MSDLISRSALIERIKQEPTDGMYTHEIIEVIEEQPTVEAVPVVHGEWIKTKYHHFESGYKWECSNCKSQMTLSDDTNGHPNFCPQCGAGMRKKVSG